MTDTDDSGAIEERVAKVIEAFDRVNARWSLIGAHAVGMLTGPRATEDFDFVVDEASLKPVLLAIEQAFGPLPRDDIGAAVRLPSLKVDLVRSSSHRLFREAIEHSRRQGPWNIPRPELLILLRFLSSVSPWRGQDRRHRDMADLIEIYRSVGIAQLDLELMLELARTVYPGAEREFADLLGRIDCGDPIAI